jgi:cytochrome c-type biogenesis protein
MYYILFLDGIVTFISPCLLPMLPVYLIYFAGGEESRGGVQTAVNAVGFVIGFTVVFVMLGAFAGFFGGLLSDYKTAVNVITGSVVVLLGLNYLGILKINFRFKTRKPKIVNLNFFSALVLGIVFSIAWTPCVSAFLGAALMKASQQGHMLEGMIMLFIYSMGLGLPFIVSAVLIDRLKDAFDFIKKHYRIVNIVSGGLLVLMGILMMGGAEKWVSV